MTNIARPLPRLLFAVALTHHYGHPKLWSSWHTQDPSIKNEDIHFPIVEPHTLLFSLKQKCNNKTSGREERREGGGKKTQENVSVQLIYTVQALLRAARVNIRMDCLPHTSQHGYSTFLIQRWCLHKCATLISFLPCSGLVFFFFSLGTAIQTIKKEYLFSGILLWDLSSKAWPRVFLKMRQI